MNLLLTADQLQRPVPGGIGTYIRGLATALATEHEVTLWGSRDRLPFIDVDVKERHSGWPLRALVKAWDLGRTAPPHAYDFVHATSLAVPPKSKNSLSVTVHDVAWHHHPEAYPSRGRKWHEAALQRAIDRADVLFTPSAATAAELLEAGVAADRVVEIIEGTDHLPPPDDGATDLLLNEHGISDAFLLTVGTLEPRKNLRRLFDAYENIRSELPDEMPLVVVGPAGWGNEVAVPDGVVAVGAAEAPVIAALYRRCHVFISVPLLEGWGLPVAEAMSMGAPVVCSAVPSAGAGARVVDPTDTDAIAEAVLAVASDDVLRQKLVETGSVRASELTWSRSAAQHVAAWSERI